jgi:hypothetical protein
MIWNEEWVQKLGHPRKSLVKKTSKGKRRKGRKSDGGKAMETIESFGGGEVNWEGESWLFNTEKASSSYSSHLLN